MDGIDTDGATQPLALHDPDVLIVAVMARRVDDVWTLSVDSPAPPWATLGMLQAAVRDLEESVAPEWAVVGLDDDND